MKQQLDTCHSCLNVGAQEFAAKAFLHSLAEDKTSKDHKTIGFGIRSIIRFWTPKEVALEVACDM